MPRRGRLTMGRIRVLRRVMLLLAIVIAAGLGGLYLIGRLARPELGRPGQRPSGGERSRQAGSGFDHTVTQEGRPLLRIRGKRDRRDDQGNLHVEEVLITAFQEDGTRYELAADTATYNIERREALLRGEVSLAGPGGFTLETEALRLRNGGRALESEQPVRFSYGTRNVLTGRSRELFSQLDRGIFQLRGGVTLRSQRPGEEEPYVLTANRIHFQRDMHQVRAEENVQLRWGRSQLRADRVAAHLATEDRRLQFLRARWGVKTTFFDRDPAGHERHLVVEGDSLAVLLDEAGRTPARLELEGPPGQPAHLRRAVGELGQAFNVNAPRLEAELIGGRVSTLQAGGGVIAVTNESGAARRLVANTVAVEFAGDGTVALATASGEVRLVEEEQRILADRVSSTPVRTEAQGGPAVLISPRGELRAPRLVYTTEARLAHALGGVEATMAEDEGNPLRRSPLAESDEPVQVQAEEAFWRDQPRSFMFRGGVRAWSGDRVVRSEQLRGDAETSQLTAAGKVETVWFVPAAEPGGAPRRVRVSADTLTYDERARNLQFDGQVRVVEAQRTLRCRSLTVELDETGEAQRMLASGEVRLEAPTEGRTIGAERADYDLGQEQVVFHGAPVTLRDAKGGTLNGAQAVYSTRNGKVRVTGAPEPVAAPSPTP